ncbi:MAG: tyrosine-type recombinase/integrase [Acidobacteriota bacterium]
MPRGKPRPRKNLTKRTVERLKATDPRGQRFYDETLDGFGVVVYASGKKSFFIEYGPKGRRRRARVGSFPPLTAEGARELATKLLADVTKGGDPLLEREARRAVPTADAWFTNYLAGLAGRVTSLAVARCYLEWAADRWRGRPLDSITQEDVEAALQHRAERRTVPARYRKGKAPGHVLRAKGKAVPGTRTVGGRIGANRWLQAVRPAFEAAVRAGVIDTNPARYVRKFQENEPRQRVLTDEELARLLAEVDKLPPVERALFRLLVESGCRRSEALRARWEDIDFTNGVWTLRSTKAGRVQSMPLPRATLVRLAALPRSGPFVFPSPRRPDAHRVELRSLWRKLIAVAKLDGVRIHDLRRTYGLAVARRAGILAASKLLRHSSIGITARVYAPLTAEELRDVANEVAGEREARVLAMRPRASAK